MFPGPCVRDPCLNLECPKNQMCLPSFDLASARCVCKGPCPESTKSGTVQLCTIYIYEPCTFVYSTAYVVISFKIYFWCIVLYYFNVNCIRTWIIYLSRFIKVYINNLFGIQYRFDIYKHKRRTYSAHSCFPFLTALKIGSILLMNLEIRDTLAKNNFFFIQL